MTKLESLSALWELAGHSASSIKQSEVIGFCQRINQEIDSRYMLLPVDADGVPIKIGDKMQLSGNRVGTVVAVSNTQFTAMVCARGEKPVCQAEYHYHVKPRTVEDVLSEVALEIVDVGYVDVPGVGNVPKLSINKSKLRDWLEEHDELQMRGDAE